MAGTGKSRRGFASMDPSRQKEIASKGGRAAHEKGTVMRVKLTASGCWVDYLEASR